MRTFFYIYLINKDSSNAYRANIGNFSKKIAERQQIIKVMMKFNDSTRGIFFQEKIAQFKVENSRNGKQNLKNPKILKVYAVPWQLSFMPK